jgi:integrase
VGNKINGMTHTGTNLWRAGCGDNSHVRFGGRAEETDRPKDPHRASARPNHTCATLLLEQGVPLKVISDLLGHSSLGITADIYTEVVDALKSDAVSRMDGLFR